jgi:Ca2+-binding RTX toxin-like protein
MAGAMAGGRVSSMTKITPRTLRLLAATLTCTALVPAAAHAGTLSYEGDTLVLRAASGEANDVTLSGEEPGRVSISDGSGHTFPADRCTQLDPQYAIHCDVPAAVRIQLGDGNDRLVVNHTAPSGLAVTGMGEDGRDELKAIAGQTKIAFDGGADNDILRSEEGGDILRGGSGDDELAGNGGADVLEGGDGGDKLTGDGCGDIAADVLDGGTGYDTLTDWGDCGPGSDRRPVTVSVNGTADDGRPGEGDDVRDLDMLQLFVPATVIGGDADENIEIFAPSDAEPSSVQGRGGADSLRSGSGRETLDGGTGADRVEGGYGNDNLIGGPGRDEIHGDSTGGQCGGNGQSCTYPFGNDTIQARDGEVDQIDCGAGTDRAVVDTIDVVDADCETVERSGGGTGSGSGAGGGSTPAGARMKLTVPGRLRLTLRDGLVVRLTGFRAGAVKVRARLGRKLVAVKRVKVGNGGTATARLRFTRTARRTLARRKVVRLTITAGSLKRTITVTRAAA